MRDAFLTLDRAVSVSVEVKRSVFRCDLAPVDSEDAARARVDQARKEFWDARHHCSAFVLGVGSAVRRSNDDGEPSGTAGRPILDVLVGAGLTDVVAVVTRWFGGTLLGTGGLVKAYGDATRAALVEATVVRHERREVLRAEVDLADVGRVEHAVRAAGHVVLNVDYAILGGSRAVLEVAVAPEEVAQANSLLAVLCGGRSAFQTVGQRWAKVSEILT